MKGKTFLDNPLFTHTMIFLSILQFINLYTENSINCLGVFGITYFICIYFSKNKGVCLLMSLVISSLSLGCGAVLEGLTEDMNPIAGCGENINPTWVKDQEDNKKKDRLEEEKTKCEDRIKIEDNRPVNATDEEKKKEQDDLIANYKKRLAYINTSLTNLEKK